jgi:hypothetical protein
MIPLVIYRTSIRSNSEGTASLLQAISRFIFGVASGGPIDLPRLSLTSVPGGLREDEVTEALGLWLSRSGMTVSGATAIASDGCAAGKRADPSPVFGRVGEITMPNPAANFP